MRKQTLARKRAFPLDVPRWVGWPCLPGLRFITWAHGYFIPTPLSPFAPWTSWENTITTFLWKPASLEKCLFSSLANFLIGSFIFLELSWRSCLYIFEINHFSVASFAIIFSQSEGCLFTLLIVSFAVQKLLRFIRSHLFIFAFISNILGCGS